MDKSKITFGKIQKVANQLQRPQELGIRITVMCSEVLRDGQQILLMSKNDFLEFNKTIRKQKDIYETKDVK